MKFWIILLLSASTLAYGLKPLVPYQKPGAAIRLASPQSIKLDPHSSAVATVIFATRNIGHLTISAIAKEGLTLENSITEERIDLSNGPVSLALELRSAEAGSYHVMFHATIDENGVQTSRVFGVPVYVGEYVGNNEAGTTPAVQKSYPEAIIMRGEETIK